MAGPAMVIVAGLATLYLAVRFEDGLVVDDYYRQGLAINATLAREDRARALGISATLRISPQRDAVQVRLAGRFRSSAPVWLRLVHPTRAGQDHSTVLLPLPDGGYGARIGLLERGAWRVLLEDEASGWRIAGLLRPGQEVAELRPERER